MAETIGYAMLQIAPSIQGIQGNLQNQLGGPLVAAGRRAGQDAGAAIADGIAASRAAVEKASENVAKAQDKVADAAGKVRVAEAKLQELRDRGITSGSRFVTATEALERAQRGQTQASGNAERATRNLEQAQERASRATTDAGDSAERSERRLGSLSGAFGRASEALSNFGQGASGQAAGSGLGDGIVSGLSGKLQGLAGKGGPIAAALVGIAGIGIGAGAVLAGAIADGMEQEKQADLIQARLGTNDETMLVIGSAAGAAYTNAFGESVNGNMAGIQAAIQSGLLSGEETAGEMQPIIEKLATVSELMDEDISAVARSAGQAMKNGLATDGVAALDLLTQGTLKSLNVSGDLNDSFNEYSTQLRALGLEGEEGWALVAQGVQAGARDTDVVIDALKEFKLRVTDGTAAGAVGFDKLNVSAEQMKTAMNQGGDASRDMMATLLRNLNEISDPVAKNEAALALFGTKFEDIQEAAFALNLDTAVQEFGNVDGAAGRAADTMGGNAATAFIEAQRSIEVSMDGVKRSLSDAFGPTLTQVADWVSTHQPEIIGFFVALADGALATGQGIASFSSGTLRVMATLTEGTGKALGFITSGLGGVTSAAASLASALGMDGIASDLRGVGDQLSGFQQSTESSADMMREFADKIDQGNDVLGGLRTQVADTGAAAVSSAELMRALGDDVMAIPGDKSITINSNSPEQSERLSALGLQVRELPDGQFEILANTAAGQEVINGFILNNNGRAIDIDVNLREKRIDYFGSLGYENPGSVQGPVPVVGGTSGRAAGGNFATGGLFRGKGGPTDDANIIKISDREHLAFITRAQAVSGRTLPLLNAINNGWVPSAELLHAMVSGTGSLLRDGDYTGNFFGQEEDSPAVATVLGLRSLLKDGDYTANLNSLGVEEDNPMVSGALGIRDWLQRIPGFADGGIVDGMSAFVNGIYPDMTLTSSFRDGDPGYHGSGMAGDFSNGSGNTPEMLGLANAIAEKYPNSLELIHSNPAFKGNIKNGQNVGDGMSVYGASTMGEHENHVHWAMDSAPSAVPGMSSVGDDSAGMDLGTIPAPEGGLGGGAAGSLATALGSDGSGGSAGGGGFSSGGGSSVGGTFSNEQGAVKVAAGDATPVFVTNMPAAGLAGSASSSGLMSTESAPTFESGATDQSLAMPDQAMPAAADAPPVGGTGVDASYGAGESGNPEVDKWTAWAQDVGNQWKQFGEDNWREMLNTAVGFGLGGIGGGGSPITVNANGQDPRAVTKVLVRSQNRRSRAMQRSGGLTR